MFLYVFVSQTTHFSIYQEYTTCGFKIRKENGNFVGCSKFVTVHYNSVSAQHYSNCRQIL